jgi:GNAT superfamily N-acetyltransferase
MSLAEYVIRPATKREIPEIERMSVAAYLEYRDEAPAAIFDAYIKDLGRLTRYWDEAEVTVVEVGGRIAGSVMFYADASSEGLGLPKEWAGFRKLAVHPAMRRHGLGRKLTERCVETAGRLGAATIGLHTVSFMKAACAIYEQSGFRRCPEYDLRASDLLSVDAGAGEVMIIAYRLGLR